MEELKYGLICQLEKTLDVLILLTIFILTKLHISNSLLVGDGGFE